MMQSPFSIGRLELKNRVVMPAMGVNLSTQGGGVSDDIIAFYEARARGGVGLIISEVTRVVDGAGASEPCQIAARGIKDVPDLQRLIETIHKYDTKIFIQLQHPGMMAAPVMTGEKSVAPSVLPGLEEVVRELGTEECEELIQCFITGAITAQMAGADGIELHAAHGYLINEFLSPATNFRKDKYGGSFEGRMSFAAEILNGIKSKCGPHFPVSVRINAEEDIPGIPGGIDLDEAKKIAFALEEAGADMINVSCMSIGCIEPGTYEQAWKKYMAAAVKESVKIPVMAVCNIKEPETGEQLLTEGLCDLIGVGRAQLADPEWCNKALKGNTEDIRICLGCLSCFSEICKVKRVKCAVNPHTGHELEYAVPNRNGKGETVAVIGGGPAGIEAATVLKDRGFAPVIFEEKERLGGSLNVADKGYGKTLITKYVDSLIRRVEQEGIEVRLGEKATAESLRALKPAGIIISCGASPLKPPIKGIDGENVCTAEDVLIGKVKPTGKIAIIGTGMTGLETAEMIAAESEELILVEMLDSLGPGMYESLVADVMSRITPHEPKVLTGHRLERIDAGKIVLTRLEDGETIEQQVDRVVLAMGVRPRKDIVEEFKNAFDNVLAVGDARSGGRILEATQDAHAKAFVFEA